MVGKWTPAALAAVGVWGVGVGSIFQYQCALNGKHAFRYGSGLPAIAIFVTLAFFCFGCSALGRLFLTARVSQIGCMASDLL